MTKTENTTKADTQSVALRIEQILVRRALDKKLDGHTLDTSQEIAAMLSAPVAQETPAPTSQVVEPQFRRKEDRPCSCGRSAILEMNLHDDDCDARLIYEYNCMVTHRYYADGWNACDSSVVSPLDESRR